jgi:hypothetical protein
MRYREKRIGPGDPLPSMASLGADGSNSGIEIDVEGFDGLELQHDPSPAEWVMTWPRRVRYTVSAVVPPRFEAYARIDEKPQALHKRPRVEALVGLLSDFTTTPDHAWFCLWEGYGGLGSPPSGTSLLQDPPGGSFRRYLVFKGALSAVGATLEYPLRQLPDLFWPEDAAWFVGSDTDLDWMYIGGTESCIDALLRDRDFVGRRVGSKDALD